MTASLIGLALAMPAEDQDFSNEDDFLDFPAFVSNADLTGEDLYGLERGEETELSFALQPEVGEERKESGPSETCKENLKEARTELKNCVEEGKI